MRQYLVMKVLREATTPPVGNWASFPKPVLFLLLNPFFCLVSQSISRWPQAAWTAKLGSPQGRGQQHTQTPWPGQLEE